MNIRPFLRKSFIATVAISLLVFLLFIIIQPIHSFRYNVIILMALIVGLAFLIIYLYLKLNKSFYFVLILTLAPFLIFLNNTKIDSGKLRGLYLGQLRSFSGTNYVWGGENSLGIDCSGLPRKSMINALWMYGVVNFNGLAIRNAVYYWWYDASALELIGGYRDNTQVFPEIFAINDGNLNAMPGDMAITKGGVHVMVYLDQNQIIQAEPDRGRVVIDKLPEGGSPWYNEKVKLVRWSLLN